MRRRILLCTVLALAIGGSALLGPSLRPALGGSPGVGPHDVRHAELDVAEYWLPRHRAEVARRGLEPNPVRRAVPGDSSVGVRFKKPKRVSHDVLDPSDAPPVAQAETQTEPYLAANPEDPDNLLAGWQENRHHDGGARALGFAVTTDGGRSWTEGRIPGLTTVDGGEWDRASDPWPAYGPDGVAYFSSLLVTHAAIGDPNAIGVSRSEDGGVTWGPLVEVYRSERDFNDKNSMVVDTSTSKHRGNVYVTWDINVAGAGGFVAQRMVVARSRDGGTTFEAPRTLAEGYTNIGIIPRVGADGTVYAIWSTASLSDTNLSIVFSKSTNGGARWSAPRKIADHLGTGVFPYRSGVILPSFDIDPVDGRLYVAWPDSRFNGTDQAALIVSEDGGDTWSEPVRVSDHEPLSLPVLTVGVAARAGGGVIVGYYGAQSEGLGLDQLAYVANVSADGGETFAPAKKVTRHGFCGCSAAQANGLRMLGDYVGLAGAGDRFFTLFTAAHKRSRIAKRKQPDIYAARSR